ncbi:unnamed protein product [Vitrella brassicaformis CCMP3155]|uniref:Uncharacterized protein n=1 Tax=Vitrella brassicaformis (strain CCMP3155) TaxID=1169540 RepID=A0A0G4ECK2_VITBC|nr:unnamed protein product [Vitrella brassicaformis CCMP3155]|eukprot:CEL93030.1 unnamed protein product [Vitrella brassicaformis CCMP3155]
MDCREHDAPYIGTDKTRKGQGMGSAAMCRRGQLARHCSPQSRRKQLGVGWRKSKRDQGNMEREDFVRTREVTVTSFSKVDATPEQELGDIYERFKDTRGTHTRQARTRTKEETGSGSQEERDIRRTGPLGKELYAGLHGSEAEDSPSLYVGTNQFLYHTMIVAQALQRKANALAKKSDGRARLWPSRL